MKSMKKVWLEQTVSWKGKGVAQCEDTGRRGFAVFVTDVLYMGFYPRMKSKFCGHFSF